MKIGTDSKMSTPKKKGPKGPYAINNIMKNMSNERKQELREMYYLQRMTKGDFAKEVGVSKSLINEFIETLGPLQQLPQNDSE